MFVENWRCVCSESLFKQTQGEAWKFTARKRVYSLTKASSWKHCQNAFNWRRGMITLKFTCSYIIDICETLRLYSMFSFHHTDFIVFLCMMTVKKIVEGLMYNMFLLLMYCIILMLLYIFLVTDRKVAFTSHSDGVL